MATGSWGPYDDNVYGPDSNSHKRFRRRVHSESTGFGFGHHNPESARYCGRCRQFWKPSEQDPRRCNRCFAPRHERVIFTADVLDANLPRHRHPNDYIDPGIQAHQVIDREVEDWIDGVEI